MPAAYLLLRLPDVIVLLLGFTTVSSPLACGSDDIQITIFILSCLQVSLSWITLHRARELLHDVT